MVWMAAYVPSRAWITVRLTIIGHSNVNRIDIGAPEQLLCSKDTVKDDVKLSINVISNGSHWREASTTCCHELSLVDFLNT